MGYTKTIEETDSKVMESFLSFGMDKEVFAIEVRNVLEILEIPQVTSVPNSPAYMFGVINLRGSVLPLIDTRVKFGLPEIETTVDSCIIVTELEVEGERVVVGALADRVLEVFEASMEDLKPAPTINPKYKLDFIKGMIPYDEKFLMLLDISKVFSVDEIISLSQAGEE